MRNKKIILTLALVGAVILFSAHAGLCTEQAAQSAPAVHAGMRVIIIKFILTMLGVAAASVIIWLGLTFYNKFFVRGNDSDFNRDDALNTPKSLEDAVTFFIKRNKLR